MPRKVVNTTLDVDSYKQIQILAIKLGKNANDLLEEGMKMVLEKYDEKQ
jgi:hypothetical protein